MDYVQVEAGDGDPSDDAAGILAPRHAWMRSGSCGEEEFGRLLVDCPKVVFDGLPGLLAQFELS